MSRTASPGAVAKKPWPWRARRAQPTLLEGPVESGERRAPRGLAWLGFGVALVLVKLAWLACDATPMLFLGDSEAYLRTALHGWIPPDRSFVYGYLVRWLCVPFGSLWPLLIAQVGASCLAAFALALALVRGFAVRHRWAFATALLWAGSEPFALLYERYLMTEAFGLAALACFVLCTLRYLATPSLSWLALGNICALGVLVLRYSFLPIAWLAALVLPLFAVLPWRRAGLHVVASLLVTAGLHEAFCRLHGHLARRPPAYQYADGLFLVSAWAPVLEPVDFGDEALGREVLRHRVADHDHLERREADRWSEDGLVAHLVRTTGGDGAANTLARSASLRALARDPLAVAGLWLASCRTWLTSDAVRAALHYDRGERPIPSGTRDELRSRFGLEAGNLHEVATATNRWLFATTVWPWVLLTSPIWLALLLVRSRSATWLLLLTLALVALPLLVATKTVPRYLHPVAWLTFLLLASLTTRKWSQAPFSSPG